MDAFLVSTALVALAEVGDKTQLLALCLAARFRRPRPIILGILIATLLNHALAGMAGIWLNTLLGPEMMRLILGLSFLAMAVWLFIPDKLAENGASCTKPQLGVFSATLIAFFLAEMGDKTQFATIALAARFDLLLAVVVGTTLGMMMANIPVVLIGKTMAGKLPVRFIHACAALIFALLGVATFCTDLPKALVPL